MMTEMVLSNQTANATLTLAPPPALLEAPPLASPLVFVLLGMGLSVLIALTCSTMLRYWVVHRAFAVGGYELYVFPSAAAMQVDRDDARRIRNEAELTNRMKFGADTLVRGRHLVRLAQYHNIEMKPQVVIGSRPHSGKAAETEPSPYPVDRIQGDGVTSYPTARGQPPEMPWSSMMNIAADGARINVDDRGSERHTPATMTELSSGYRPPPPSLLIPSGAEDCAPLYVTLPPIEPPSTGGMVPVDDHRGFVRTIRRTLTGSYCVVASDDPRLPQHSPASVFESLHLMHPHRQRVPPPPAVPSHSVTAAVNDTVTRPTDWIVAWMSEAQAPLLHKERLTRLWTRELPLAPIGDAGEQSLAYQRTRQWVLAGKGAMPLPSTLPQ